MWCWQPAFNSQSSPVGDNDARSEVRLETGHSGGKRGCRIRSSAGDGGIRTAASSHCRLGDRRPAVLLQEVKATPSGGGTFAEVTLPVQDISNGPLIGVSQEGAAKIILTGVEISAGLTKKILARFDLFVKTTDPYKSPLQEVQDGSPGAWFVTN